MRMCWKRTNRFQAIVAVLGLWGACTLGVAQTISNPSFESNSFTVYPGYISSNTTIVGWTTTDTNYVGLNPASGNQFADNGAVPDGTNVAFIESNPGLNSDLSTVISNLTVGETYKVNFRVNARTNVGGLPNLNVWIDAANIVNSTVTPVAPMGVTNIPYKYFAFDFTAADTNQMMTLSNDAAGDQTVLVDNFSIALRNSGWSYGAWNDDASSGVTATNIYTHAFAFGTSASPVINGVTFTGIFGANPSSSGVFSTAGLPNVFNGDNNNLTSGGGGSGVLAGNFVYGGAVESITIQGLTIGQAYVATIYSVGFDASGTRAATFSLGNDLLTVNQDQFGYHNGIRVSYSFTANATSNTLTYVPLSGSTFHTYGFSVYQLHGLKLVVTNAADSGPGTLRQLVSQADAFTQITFTNTLSGQTIVLTNGQITTSNNITIDASSLPAGITVSGNNSNRIFEVSAGATLSLNALTLTNGYAGSGGNGGAILVDTNGTLTLNNSTLSGNTATGTGGAVGSFAGVVSITNSTLSGNAAAGAGAIEDDNGTLNISASTLSGNVTTGNGGAILVDTGGTLTLTGSTLSGNAATNSGGGIYSVGTLTINNSTLSGNSAAAGGGIENYQATAIINNCTLSANSAGVAGGINNYGTLALTNVIVASNAAPSSPDIYLDSSGSFTGANNLTNVNPLLAALGNYGGPTQTMPPLAGSPAIDAGTDSVTNFLATDQRGFPRLLGAHVDIGAVEYVAVVATTADSGSGSLRDAVANSSIGVAIIAFTNTLSGQTIVLTNGQLSISNNITIDASSLSNGVTVSGNYSNRIFEVSSGGTLKLNSLTLINGYAGSGGSGGAILVDSRGTLTLNSSTLSGNSAANGGGISGLGGATLTLNNSTLSGNSAASDGGGIYGTGTSLTAKLNNSTLAGNSAALDGGGIYVSGSLITVKLNNSTLSGNSAVSGVGGGISAPTAGHPPASVTLTNTIVAGNYAGSGYTNIFGGGASGVNNLTNGDPQLAPLYNYGGPTQTMPPLPWSPAIDAGTDAVTNFLATDQRGFPRLIGAHVDIGAAEYFYSPSRPFVTTTADVGAGSLRDATEFATNGATITFTNTLSGQTILLTNGQITLGTNVTIDASSLPAGVTLSGNHSNRIFEVMLGVTVTLNSLTLINGYAGSGGSGGAILVDSGGTLTLNSSTLSGNSATSVGGGINSDGPLTINNSTLSGNSAPYGGGIANGLEALTVNNSTLSGNSAAVDGGAIFQESFEGSSGDNILNNTVVAGNSAYDDGGGIYNSGTFRVNNSTLSGNSASVGGGIYNSGNLFLTNTIVAGDSASSAFADVDSVASYTAVNSLTNGNPLLAPLGNYGGPTQTMPPLFGSPAIDAGTDSVTNFLATDQRGLPREFGAHVDIGSVELQYALVTTAANSGGGSLRDAVAISPNGYTIAFTNTLSGQTIVLTTGQITTSNNITIDASSLPAGISLSGNNSNRIFEVSAGATLTLNSLTLTNGYAGSGGNGGAILVDTNGTLTLNSSTLAGNSASGVGGGIENLGLVAIANSSLSGNAAAYAGAIENDSGTLIISASTLSGNVATNNGGAIDNDAGALLRLDNSTLAGNSAVGGGGIENDQATAIINNSTISTNSAGGAGGINNFGALAVTNTIVAGNTAPSFPNIYLDGSGSLAGANNLTNGNPLLASLGNYGGPTQTMPPLAGSPAIDGGNDSVTSFLATDQRGFPREIGAHVDIGAVEYFVSPLVTTTADSGSGSLRNAAAYTTNGATITFAPALSGQTILLTNGQITLNDNITIDASGLPGGISVSGNHASRIFEVSAGTIVTLDWLTLTNGYAGFGNGGAVLVDTNGTLTLNNSTLCSNSATGGGGMFNNGTLELNNSTLSDNAAADGGGIYNPGTLTLNNSTLSGNSASNNGGAVLVDTNGILSVYNSTLCSNSAGNIGGGIDSDAILILLFNTIVAVNSAQTADPNIFGSIHGPNNLVDVNPLLAPLGNYGGPTQTMPPLPGSPALDAGMDSVTNFLATDQRGFPRKVGAHVDIGAVEYFSTNTLVTTTADASAGSLRDAMFTTNGTTTITFANALSGQTIVLTGGQITLSQNVTIDASSLPAGVTVSGNDASRIFLVNAGAVAVLKDLAITDGNGGGPAPNANYGGAIYNQGNLALINCLVSSNQGFAGGSIYNSSGGGILALNACTLASNSASFGGAIQNEGMLAAVNSTFNANTGTNQGGAISAPFSAPTALTQCTLTGNTAGDGGGIYGVAITLTNSIVAGNTATNNTNNISGAFTYGGNNLTNGNPLLVPLGNYGGLTPTMPPLSGSPAIDAGSDLVTNSLATDQRGFPRLSGAHVDLGAVEVQFVAVPTNNPVLKNVVWTSAGGSNAFQFSFTNVSGADFTALASTNVSLPLSNWTVLGNIQEVSAGQYQFIDSGTTNFVRRFYVVVSP